MNRETHTVYFFPAYFLMIPLLVGAILMSAFSYSVIHPVCDFIRNNSILLTTAFIAILIFIGYRLSKSTKSIKFGVGATLSIGQFILLLILIMFEIASVSDPNKVDTFSIVTTAIVSLLSFAYGSFNCKMVVDAFTESHENSNTLLIVGIVGVIIDILIILFV